MQFQISSWRENFTLSDVEDNTSRPLNWGGIADLPFLRTLLAIFQKSQEPSFWEVMDSIVLLAYASLAASRTPLQWLPACLNFTLDSEDLSFWYKKKKKNGDFYELWQQHNRPVVNEWHVVVLAYTHTCQYLFRCANVVPVELYTTS